MFTKLNEAMDMYEDAESGFSNFDKEDIEDAIFGPVDEKNKLDKAHRDLWEMFKDIPKNAESNAWQVRLKEDDVRHEFYDKLSAFAKLLNLALTNRAIYKEVGFTQLDAYRRDFLFFKKLKDAVSLRYGDSVDFGKYEDGIRNLLNTFVTATDVRTIVDPVVLTDEEWRKRAFEILESNEARADAIRTKIVSELKQKRMNDPLLCEEFSQRIKKTLDQYAQSRDADQYLKDMERIADDLRAGRSSTSYPAKIENDNEAKMFYGAVYGCLEKVISADLEKQECIGDYAIKIKECISSLTKRDWRVNPIVHKKIHSQLDDILFDLFEELEIDCNEVENIKVLDSIIEEIMRVAMAKY